MNNKDKIDLIRKIKKLTLLMFQVPGADLDMNDTRGCAIHFHTTLTHEICEVVNERKLDTFLSPKKHPDLYDHSLRLLAVTTAYDYTQPSGPEAKREFRRRAIAFIKDIVKA